MPQGKTRVNELVTLDTRSVGYLVVVQQIEAVKGKWARFFAEFPNGSLMTEPDGSQAHAYSAEVVKQMRDDYNSVLQNVATLIRR